MAFASRDLILIMNLYNASVEHKKHCKGDNCNVSLVQLKETARIIQQKMCYEEEFAEVNKLFDKWPF